MQVSIWYPAETTNAATMRYRDYVALSSRAAFYGLDLLRDLTPAQREQLEVMETAAVRDAKPLARRFPLVLWSLHVPALSHVTPEYLASHGYVVVSMPRIGVAAGSPETNIDAADFETKQRDLDFLINTVAALMPASADAHNIGAIGFSAGGKWMTGLAMRNPDVRAVVSLDSALLWNDATHRSWSSLPSFSLDRMRVPLLHIIRTAWVPREDAALWTAMRHADRTYVEVPAPGLDHFDYQSMGYATTLVGGRPQLAKAVAEAFHEYHRLTLTFLDAHLKGDTKARTQLATIGKRLPAEPAPPTTAQFLEAMQEEGLEPTLAVFRSTWKSSGKPPVDEAALNTVGYVLMLAERRIADAVKVFSLATEAFPASANAQDSLGDAYLALGDTENAKAAARKALALLDKDPSPPARKEQIRQSATSKL